MAENECVKQNPHLIGGKFKSDKYECPAGKVPLSTSDPLAQDLLWIYQARREDTDPSFSAAVRADLLSEGYVPGGGGDN